VKTFLAVLFLSLLSVPATGRAAADVPASGTEPYYLVFLRPNPDRKAIPQADRERIMTAHLANIHKMADDGVLVAAGPMEDNPATISGIFVFKAGSLDEARRIAALDPTVVEGRNTVDVHRWLAPSGIGTGYFRWKKEHPEAEDAMAVHALCIFKRGPAWKDEPRAADGHAAFVDSLRRSGALAAAGEVDGDPELCSVCVFKTSVVDEAREVVGKDPDVLSGRLAVEFHRWWTADRVLPW
jgi:uncharacterized protein YciI